VKFISPSPIARAALALLVTSTSLAAAPLAGVRAPVSQVELAQGRCQPGEAPEACAARRGGGGGGEARPRRQQQQEQPAEAPRARRQQQQEQPAEEAPRPRRQQLQEQPAEQIQRPRRQQQQEQPAEAPRPRRQQLQEQPAEEIQRPRRQQQQEQPAEAPRPRRQQLQEQPAEEAPRPRRQQQQEQPAEETQRPRRQQQQEQPAEAPRPRRQPQAQQPVEQAPQANPEAGQSEQQRPRNRRQGSEQPSDTPAVQPDQGGEQQRPRNRRQGDQQQPSDTPVLQDGCQQGGERPRGRRQGTQQPADTPSIQPDAGQQQPQAPRSQQNQSQGPVPRDDRAAQEGVRNIRPAPVTAEEGRRIQGDRRFNPRERKPRSAEVVRELGDRFVLQLGGNVYVESDERPRMRRDATEFYTEELPRGRIREVVIRRDGTRVITIYNRNGDIIRRSRIGADDREYVLVYVDDNDLDYLEDWRDPGLDLPPLVLDIPREEYILDAEYVQSDEDYYTFLEQPPVETVERLYSVDEVKRSARIRQKTRRIDLDTITFEFGSDQIPEDQISRLEGVANAIQRLLEKNPAETVLIEGHTDAVGSEYANLALSDRRAEAVATALTNVFEIPPENLTTQGYGEEFLKVQSDGPERENRRVAIRRITPLVAPVASAN